MRNIGRAGYHALNRWYCGPSMHEGSIQLSVLDFSNLMSIHGMGSDLALKS